MLLLPSEAVKLGGSTGVGAPVERGHVDREWVARSALPTPFSRRGRNLLCTIRRVPTGIRIAARDCHPCLGSPEKITPFANGVMNSPLRRRMVPLPSETDDATMPWIRRIRAHEPRGRYAPSLMRAGIGPCHVARAIDPASSDFSRETILPQARRTTTLFPVDHAPMDALARIGWDASSPMRSGVEWPELGWLGRRTLLAQRPLPSPVFPFPARSRRRREIQPPEPMPEGWLGTREKSQGIHLSPALRRLVWR